MTSYTDLYADVEPHLMPVIRAMALKFARPLRIEPEDAVQEARIALMEAFRDYDYNKSHGGIQRFARTSIHNAFCGLLHKATRDRRTPHTVYEDDGELRVARGRLGSLEDLEAELSSPEPTPEDLTAAGELEQKIRVVWMKLVNSLGERERAVLSCQSRPSDEFMDYLRNIGVDDPTNLHIARFLGMSKNAVDWSSHKIKLAFLRIVEQPEFNDMIGDLVKDGEWPMIHVSHKADDHEFVRSTIEQRQLDPRPVEGGHEAAAFSDGSRRIIETYGWGSVVFLQHGDHAATLVIEGRFNVNSGEVFGVGGGFWRPITDAVPWYRQMTRQSAMESKRKMPKCLGLYEADDHECNGDPKGEHERDRMACVYRDRCVAFGRLCSETKVAPTRFLKFRLVDELVNGKPRRVQYAFAKGDEDAFQERLARVISERGITNGKVTVRVPGAIVQAKPAPKRAGEAACVELAAWLNKQLRDKMRREFARDNAHRAGELFIVDRTSSSGYLSVYVQQTIHRKRAVVSAFYRPALGTLEVRVAVDFTDFRKLLSKSDCEKLKPEDITGKDGAFKVRIRGVDKERATIVAEALARADSRGIFGAPEASG